MNQGGVRVETPSRMTSMRTPPLSGGGGARGRACGRGSGDASIIETLRRRVRGCIDSRHSASAVFFGDKLFSLSPSEPGDVLLFAEACYLNREFHRAIHVVKMAGLVRPESANSADQHTLQAFLLVGQSMLTIKAKEECVELLGAIMPGDEISILQLARHHSLRAIETGGINIVSSLALLLGDTYESMAHRERALVYYRIALQCDVRCVEAFFHLVDKQMLTDEEQRQLMETLDFSAEESDLIRELYGMHINKYDTTAVTEAKFLRVEEKFGLGANAELNIVKAETYYNQHDVQRAYKICDRIRESNPFIFKVVPVFVAAMVELGMKAKLFEYAHDLVNLQPKRACSWYAVGCYYLTIQKYDAAQRFFHKATTLDSSFAPAWIGFGNAFAAQDESDQAMSSYRTASTLFPGCHLPPLYIGMEYLRTNNLSQALECFKQASVICPNDPLIYSEIGSVYFKQEMYENAVEMYTKALELCKHLPERLMEHWEPTFFNLGYSYQKLRKYEDAVRCFRSAQRLAPRNASIHAALGFTLHMKGAPEDAVECYHAALVFNSEEVLAGEMITLAFEESLSVNRAIRDTPLRPTTRTGNTRSIVNRLMQSSNTAMSEERVQRTLQLHQSFNSSDHSHVHQDDVDPNGSSLNLSDDSSMIVDE